MSDIEVRELDSSEYELWDNLVEKSPQGTVFHKSDWLKIVEKHTKSKLYLLVGYLGNEIIAGIPFFYHRRFCFRKLSSPVGSAMIQNLGPIILNYNDLKQDKKEFYFREFQKALDKYINLKIKPHIITITTSPKLIDVRPYIWCNYQILPKYNYIKNIEDINLVWSGFKKQLRKNIVKSEKVGITINEGDINNYNIIIQSLSKRLEEQDSRFSVPNEYLLDLYHTFHPNNLRIFYCNYEGKQISGIVVTTYKDKISIWVGATQANLKGLYPVDLLQWKIIEWGNQNGYKFCEILGANIPSISYFKSRYNFDLDIYFDAKKTKINQIDNKITNNIGTIILNCFKKAKKI